MTSVSAFDFSIRQELRLVRPSISNTGIYVKYLAAISFRKPFIYTKTSKRLDFPCLNRVAAATS